MKTKYFIIILATISAYIISPAICQAKINTSQINKIKNKLSSLNSGQINETIYKTVENKTYLIFEKQTIFNKKENKLFIKKIFSPNDIIVEEYHVNINNNFYYKIKLNNASPVLGALSEVPLPTSTNDYLNNAKSEKWNIYDAKLLKSVMDNDIKVKDIDINNKEQTAYLNSEPYKTAIKLGMDAEMIGTSDFKNSKDKINYFINLINNTLKISDIKNLKTRNLGKKIITYIEFIEFKQPAENSILANSIFSDFLIHKDWTDMNDHQKISFGALYGLLKITKVEIPMEKEQIKNILFYIEDSTHVTTDNNTMPTYAPYKYTYNISFENNNKPVNIYKPKDL